MPSNLRMYIDFTADLQRVINCLINNNEKSAAIFFIHALEIYNKKILPVIDVKYFPEDLHLQWKKLSCQDMPKTKKELLRFADKVLTIYTILFNRTTYYAFN